MVQSEGSEEALALNEVILFDPLEKYRTLAAGIYEWSGLPDNVPEGYIEETLFDHGAISAKESWRRHSNSTSSCGDSWRVRRNPHLAACIHECDWFGNRGATGNIGYSSARRRNSNCGNSKSLCGDTGGLSNIVAAERKSVAATNCHLRQPGNAAETITLKNELDYGALAIPLIERTAMDMEAIDLKASDYPVTNCHS